MEFYIRWVYVLQLIFRIVYLILIWMLYILTIIRVSNEHGAEPQWCSNESHCYRKTGEPMNENYSPHQPKEGGTLEYGRKPNWFERLFGKTAILAMKGANPFKKFAFKTPALMHRYINIQAVHLLENEGYYEAADFYRDMIRPLNEGVTWIDQDFKSINHFFHFEKKVGLYGFSDALTEAVKYRQKIMDLAKQGNLTSALFYTGVVLHLTQDMTVPQHVMNRLLDSHRDYEVWILSNAWDKENFNVGEDIVRYRDFSQYFTENAKLANQSYAKAKLMENKEAGYRQMAHELIPTSIRSTAGLLLDFYENFFCEMEESLHGERQKIRQMKEEDRQFDELAEE